MLLTVLVYVFSPLCLERSCVGLEVDKPPFSYLAGKKPVWTLYERLSPAAEPNCVVVLVRRDVSLHEIFMMAAGGKSSVLDLHEVPLICREKSVLLFVLFPALDTC